MRREKRGKNTGFLSQLLVSYLVKSIENVGNQWGTRTRVGQSLHQAKVAQITDVSVGRGRREGEGVAPEVPLESDDGQRSHTGSDHAQGGLSTGETRVEETQARNHDHDHGGGHNDVGLVTRLEPFVQVLRA